MKNKEEHRKKHIELHNKLDELVTDFISHTKALPSQITVMQLIEWSHIQTIDPAGDE